MKFTANQIAVLLNGTVVGDDNAEVFKLSKIEEGTTGSLTFLSNPKYTPHIYSTNATITIVNKIPITIVFGNDSSGLPIIFKLLEIILKKKRNTFSKIPNPIFCAGLIRVV